MKSKRHEKILELILGHEVNTQEDLQRLLEAEGYRVTQATVSRDIKELRLVKTLCADGSYRYTYAAPEKSADGMARFRSIFSETVISVDNAGHMVAVKCHTGMANAACAALDLLRLGGIVGTLAGDDTIFILVREPSTAQQLKQQLLTYIAR